MKKYSNVFEKFIDFENLYKGFLLAGKNKRYRNEVLAYSANLEENLINAQNHLIWKSYKIDNMREFIEYYPKKRIITVMPFENRVVNCAAYNVLFPIYSRSFYEHSYGSIPGGGALKAVDQLQYWLRLVRNSPQKWYVCKMDITKFYFRIPFEIQLKYLGKPLDDPDMMWFLETAIRCDGRAFGLPLDAKDITTCERVPGIGMQAGSLISQMTANVVMTAADNYIKRVLKAPYYIRYMDDMIFLAPSKKQCFDILARFGMFLHDELGLDLNNKTAVMPYDKGVEFVGRRVYPDKILMRKSTSLRMKKHLKYVMKHYADGDLSFDYSIAVVRSYLGLMKHCCCNALRLKVCNNFRLVRGSDNKNS